MKNSNNKPNNNFNNQRTSIQEKRQEYHDCKREGKGFIIRRLGFLLETMRRSRWTQKDLAKAMGVTPQRINCILGKQDNTRLSFLRKAFAAMGYNLEIELYGDLSVHQEGEFFDMTIENPVSCRQEEGDVRHLSFFRRAFYASGMTYDEISLKAGFSKSTLCNIFRDDDTYVSTLYAFAQAMGLKVRWIITKE